MLNDRQIRFCEEYLSNGNNATQAAISAGYSEETAYSIASENLRKPEIAEYLETRQKQILARLEINQDRIAREYARIAFSDIRKLYADDGSLKQIKDLDEDAAATIAGIETDEIKIDDAVIGYTRKVKQWDKLKALEALGKYEGMFEKDNEQKKPPETIDISGLTTEEKFQYLQLRQKAKSNAGGNV